MRYRDVDYRTLYNVLRKRYDRTENTIANLENLKSIHENEILNLKEKLRTKDIEHVATQAQRDAAEKRADQLMRAIHDMSSANSGRFFFVVVAGLSQSCELNHAAGSPIDGGGPEQHDDENTATTTTNQVLEDLRRKWNSEIKRLRERIETQNEQNRTRVRRMESEHAQVMNDLKTKMSNLELTLRQEREAQLQTLRDFARHREQSFEQEKDRDRRVAELLGELEDAKETESRLREEIEEMDQEQDEIDEDHVEELANARAKTMLQEMLSKDFVGRPQVEKMESLYDDVVQKLKSRVEKLEKNELTHKQKRTKKKTRRETRREARRGNAVRMRYGNVGIVRGSRQRGSSHISRVRDVRCNCSSHIVVTHTRCMNIFYRYEQRIEHHDR